MSEQKMPFSRRRFLATTALGAAAAASGSAGDAFAPARAGRRREARPSSSGHRRAVLFGPAGPHRRHHGGRRDQRGRRHQGARRRQDRSGPRRRAIDARRRHRRSGEDEFGGSVLRRRRLCLFDLPRRQPGCRSLRSALCGRCRRRRFHRHPRAQEHLPLRSGLRRHRQDRARQSDDHQRPGRQAGEDGDHRSRRFAVRLRARQASERATAGEGL